MRIDMEHVLDPNSGRNVPPADTTLYVPDGAMLMVHYAHVTTTPSETFHFMFIPFVFPLPP